MLSRDVFRRMDSVPRIDRATNPHGYIKWVISIDAAYKEKQLAKDDPDFNVFGLLGFWLPDKRERLNVNIILASLMRTQMGMTAAKDMGVKFCLAMEKLLGHKPEIIGPADTLDKIILDDLRGHPDMMGWRVRSLDDPLIKREVGAFTGDKVSKFEPWRDRAQGGRFYVVDENWSQTALADAFPRATRRRLLGNEPLAWHEKFFTEVEAFPDWNHDDMVDMVSVGYHRFSTRPVQGKKKARSMQG